MIKKIARYTVFLALLLIVMILYERLYMYVDELTGNTYNAMYRIIYFIVCGLLLGVTPHLDRWLSGDIPRNRIALLKAVFTIALGVYIAMNFFLLNTHIVQFAVFFYFLLGTVICALPQKNKD